LKQLILQVWLLILSVSILMVSRGLGSAFIGVRAQIEDFSISWITFIQGCSYIGFMISGMFVPKILRNIGHIRVFATCASLSSVVPLFQSMFISPYYWAFFQIFFGIGIAGSYIVIEGWLNEASDNANRGKLFGLYSLISMFIASASPLLIGPIPPESIVLFLIISITSSLAFIPVAVGAKWTPTYAESETMDYKTLFKRSPFGMISFKFSLIIINTLFMIFIVYAIKAGFSLKVGTKSFLFMGVLSIFTTYTLGYLSDKMDRRYLIIFSSGVSIIFAYMMKMSVDSGDEYWFLISSVGLGGFLFTLYPLIVSHISDRLKVTEMLSASSWMVLLSSIMGAIGTISIGPIMETFGISAFPYLIMICLLVNCIYGMYRIYVRKGVSSEEQVDFVSISSLSNTVIEQDIYKMKKKKKKKKVRKTKAKINNKKNKKKVKRR